MLSSSPSTRLSSGTLRGPGSRVRRWGMLAGCLLLAGWWGGAPRLCAQASREYDLKAVFLYNLASFVNWPESAFESPTAPFVIGVIGDDPFGRVLDEVVANEYVGKRPFEVRRFRRSDDPSRCHVLFIASSESRRMRDVLRRVRGRPVLTVGDVPGFAEGGGMIGFATDEDHLQLFINPEATRESQLSLSSKLLEVARIVDIVASTP